MRVPQARPGIERRRFISLVAGVPVAAVVAAACGSDADPSDGLSDTPTLPPPSDAPAGTVAPEPVAPENVDVVLEYGNYGGFTTREFAFQMQPQVYVTSDNRVFTPGAMAAIYPGPLVPAMFVRTITPAGVETILDAARVAGLFAEIDYESPTNIADAGTATLRLTADGTTYTHEAYALGVGGPPGPGAAETPEREALAGFLEELSDLEGLVGTSELGEQELFVPTSYQFVAALAGDLSGLDLEPTLVDWPADTGIALAEALECVEVDREAVGDLFEEANQLTYFVEDGQPYTLAVRPTLPGRDC